MWKNLVEPENPLTTIWRMRIAYCIPKATDIHSEYVIIIVFSTATTVARTCLSNTLYVHCLSGYLQILLRTFFALVDTGRFKLEINTESQIFM